jgi:hypothetical protein
LAKYLIKLGLEKATKSSGTVAETLSLLGQTIPVSASLLSYIGIREREKKLAKQA